MWEFIVSGYIPGTDLQVSFDSLSNIVTTVLLGVLFVMLLQTMKSRPSSNDKQNDVESVAL